MSSSTTNTNQTTTWLQQAETTIHKHNLNPDLLEVLRAFGGDDAPGPTSLDPDDASLTDDEEDDDVGGDATGKKNDTISKRIIQTLSTEVDIDQASMFARRFISVSTMLQQQNTLTSKLLRLGLYRRANQILATNDPTKPGRALRIRALVDFIWSQSLVLSYSEDETKKCLPTLKQLVEGGIQYKEIAPGFRHGLIEGETCNFGPVHINVLRITKGATTMRCVDARTEGTTNLEQLVDKTNAVGGISGGFFLYSEPDIVLPSKRTDPVGLLITNGEVVNPPVFNRGSLLQDGDTGEIHIGKVGMDGVICKVHASSGETLCWTIGKEEGLRCVHRGQCKKVTVNSDEVGIAIVGRKVHEVIRGGNGGEQQMMDVPLAGFVLLLQKSMIQNIDIKPGDTVEYTLTRTGTNLHYNNIQAGMAGGPILLTPDKGVIECASELPKEDFAGSAPPVTFSQDETFDRNLLPRMGAGITQEGELVLAAIDGRNLDRALGLTLKGTAELLEMLGCIVGLNLDGGSSKRMVLKEKGTLCLHTTEIKSKAVDEKKEKVRKEKGGAHEAGDGHVPENLDAHTDDDVDKKGEGSKKVTTPELSRPVHSAILFLPREDGEQES